MRARKKKHTNDRLQKHSDILLECQLLEKESIFKNNNPMHLEIGCGKGSFITAAAQQNPQINFIAMEKVSDVAVMAVEKAAEAQLENVRFIIGDAANLQELFSPQSLECVYINFCDPWPKKKQHKRRLTHPNFLKLYKELLTSGGEICFKTDNRDLFDFSVEQMGAFEGFELTYVTYDLHNSDRAKDNIITEYEYKFSSQGMPIHMLTLKKL
ncbi:MAG: tRNA (guanosine(46)-N7)-methyltransferase TrmB [Ruminococcaceae bacterium]|nr:tRNA (guanosine(46)-N7)-methyltransferase TrmB [Oscillospiraceae bacterium]